MEEVLLKKSISTFFAASIILTTSSVAFADQIVGTWKRDSGTLIKYSKSGGSKYCGTVLNGEYQGKSIGCMKGSNGTYKGSVKKLDEGKTYNGKANVTGNTMKLAGCVLGGIICKSESLKRQ